MRQRAMRTEVTGIVARGILLSPGHDYLRVLPLLLLVLVLHVPPVAAAGGDTGTGDNCRTHTATTACDSDSAWCKNNKALCNPENRGRCGKRRGDWYGASRPVATAGEAKKLLLNYFTGPDYTVSEVTEKRWGYKSDILDKSGKIVDRVMIDKRSGRIRSLN